MMNNKTRSKRKKSFVDPQVQTAIVSRVAIYAIASVLFVCLPIAFVSTYQNPERFFLSHVTDVWVAHWPVFAGVSVLIPLMLADLVKFSNRFVGPIYRLRCELTRFSETRHLKKFQFRDSDFWKDLPDGMSEISDYIHELESEVAALKAERNSLPV